MDRKHHGAVVWITTFVHRILNFEHIPRKATGLAELVVYPVPVGFSLDPIYLKYLKSLHFNAVQVHKPQQQQSTNRQLQEIFGCTSTGAARLALRFICNSICVSLSPCFSKRYSISPEDTLVVFYPRFPRVIFR